MRRLIPALPVAALLVGPAVLAFFSGGFFALPRLAAGVGASLLVVVAALASTAHPIRPAASAPRENDAVTLLALVLAATLVSMADEAALA